eukprot:CAMPEP_0183350346 /NCGR_PEP_ID=MMETSP0164_2-20130417/18442_1 /TAXON_ID=221442 /ORGANISM="Coccolithus pelagicus ssp braarudi, Strain PLY182g" /LENGTH=316 /DNA_ID=CAMNT_0025522245 /DNA_START=40 /DNA_END=990 /DNA_ORIENTATION=+
MAPRMQLLTAAAAASVYSARSISVLTAEQWRLRMRSCSRRVDIEEQRWCMDHVMALMPHLPGSQAAIDYFFGAEPYPGIRIRTPACENRRYRGGEQYPADIIWTPANSTTASNQTAAGSNGSRGLPCLWGNMPFSKSIEIILAARNLGVTHIIESGRMGGLSLVHYAHFGFNLTSIEMLPVAHVEASLRALQPHTTILNGDGMTLVPEALSRIRKDIPGAKVAVIIDGPKEAMAIALAKKLLHDTVLVVLDDQGVVENMGVPSCTSNSKSWRYHFPMNKDRMALKRPPNPPSYARDARFYFRENDIATFLLGSADF